MDKLDHRLIAELVANGRQSNTELSLKLGISEKTVRRRISHLVEQGIITWAVIPDPAKLGYNIRVFIALEVELCSLEKVIQSLVNCGNVDFVALCTGQFDLLLGAWFSSSDGMIDFVKNYLAAIPGIRKSQTSVALEVKASNPTKMAYLQKETREQSDARQSLDKLSEY